MAVTRDAFVWTSVRASVCPLKAFASAHASRAACFAGGPESFAVKALKTFDSSCPWGSIVAERPGTIALPPLKARPPLKAFASSCHAWGSFVAEGPGTISSGGARTIASCSSAQAPWVWASCYSGGP